jgi:hypothetical protein
VRFDIGIYAVRGHLVFAAEQGAKPLKQSFAGIAKGRRLILTVPTFGGRIYPTEFGATIPASPAGQAWLLTPARCPASGHWTVTGKFRRPDAATSKDQPVGMTQRNCTGRVAPVSALIAPLLRLSVPPLARGRGGSVSCRLGSRGCSAARTLT